MPITIRKLRFEPITSTPAGVNIWRNAAHDITLTCHVIDRWSWEGVGLYVERARNLDDLIRRVTAELLTLTARLSELHHNLLPPPVQPFHSNEETK